VKVIGLTGGIATGKSTVARFLAKLGAIVIDADKVGHEILKFDTEAWQELVATFGQQILTPDGNVSRKPESLARLNKIMHHRIAERVQSRLENYRREGVGVVVFEAPVLLESGGVSSVDEIWVTVASEATVLKRLKERAGFSESESRARICSQLPAGERLGQADIVIDTDCTLDELKAKLRELWCRLYPDDCGAD